MTTDATVLLINAVMFADRAHRGQFRKDGSPYIGHLLAVKALTSIFRDRLIGFVTMPPAPVMEITALLHDVVEDTDETLDDIEVAFGHDVATGVDYLTRSPHDTYHEYVVRLTTQGPLWVSAVKLADITHNLMGIDRIRGGESLRERYVGTQTKLLALLPGLTSFVSSLS